MGSPTIFSGRYTKLLTNKGILNSDGSLNQNDGPINYVKYAEFEQNVTTGWSLGTTGTLTNAIPTGTPSFGSGASGNLSIATSNVSPIRDNFSLRYVSSAATTAGNMLATEALTIDAADQAKILTFRFYYSVVSGATTANFSGTSSNSFGVAIWDVTNSAWIGVAGNFSMTQNSGVGIASGTFQTNSNTSQIRLVIYNANATSGAITLAFDDFFVGPQTAPIGPVVTDFQSYTATTSGFNIGTTGTATTRWRRVGDSIHVIGRYVAGGTGISVSGDLRVFLPTGLSFDTSKISLFSTVGAFELHNAGAYRYGGATLAVDTTQVAFSIRQNAATLGNFAGTVTPEVGWFNAGNDEFSFEFMAPITGWSSQVQLSNDTDTRVVAAYLIRNSLAPQVANTPYNFGAAAVDTHGAWNGSTTYTIPVSGWYRISAQLQFNITATAGQFFNLAIATNGVSGDYQTKRANGTAMVSDSFMLMPVVRFYSAGQQITIVNTGTNYSSVTASGDPSFVSIERLSGPSVVAASETVACRYRTSGNTFANATEATVIYGTKEDDSHNFYNPTTGFATIPVSGRYSISALVQFVGLSSQSTIFYIAIRKGGSSGSNIKLTRTDITCGTNYSISVHAGEVQLVAGDIIDIRAYQGNLASRNLSSTSIDNTLEIVRVGN